MLQPLTRLQVNLDDRYQAPAGEVVLSGIQALVRLTLEQRQADLGRSLRTGVFVSGYEGSPLGGLDLELRRASQHLDRLGVVFRPGVNEELAATAVAGTQSLSLLPGRRVDGVTGFWYGKNPGLDRAGDAIRHGNLSGTAPLGGAVAWIGDDPASKSSTVPSSCLPMCRNLMVPVLTPGSIEEIVSLGLHAVAMSRHAGVWTAMQITTDVADATDVVDLDRARASSSSTSTELSDRPPFSPYLMLPPGNLDAELDLMESRLARVTEYGRVAGLNSVTFEPARPRTALLGVGLGYQALVRALRDLKVGDEDLDELGVRLVRLSLPWPLDATLVRQHCSGVEKVLVIEDKLAFVETLVRDSLYRSDQAPSVMGKSDDSGRPLLPLRAFVTADDVARAIGRVVGENRLPAVARERLAAVREPRARIPVAVTTVGARTPFFCSGCPHNVSTQADADQLVGLGIGCHTLAALDQGHRRGHLTGITQMGGEGAQWLGLAPFTDDPSFVQNLGDGTFHHSGSLAVRAAVASGVTMTYKILYNNAVAMTGGQRPEGQMDVPAMTRLLEAEGVARIVVTTPEPEKYRRVRLASNARVRHRDDLAAVQRELARVAGVTVLIHDDRCAAEKRRMRKRGLLETPTQRVHISERVCEGCGDCGDKATCMSLVPVATEFGRKTQVHQSSCNFDMTCLKGDCPSFLLVTPKIRRRPARPVASAPTDLPVPVSRVPDEVLIRVPGVGGTGVVTVSAILQMAAYLDGRYAAGLDQIGLAQKGGPVVSDVRLGSSAINGQLRASARSVDVILAFDIIGASAPETLAVADPLRTVAIINTTVTPTAAMVTEVTRAAVAATDVVAGLDAVTRRDENLRIDAGGVAEQLFGDHLATNMFLVGAAYQHGCLPLSADSLESAIRLNGAAVELNIEAFRWGRAAVSAPGALRDALRSRSSAPVPADSSTGTEGLASDVARVVERRARELEAYQHRRYAQEYIAKVKRVRERESNGVGPGHTDVTLAFARGLFKLMAYKDEYEVARLHLEERARLREEFGSDATVKVLLHPPVLRAVGLKRKIRLGRSAYGMFRVLRALRRLRGTWLDPFGYAAMRRLERRLVSEYEQMINGALDELAPATATIVAAIAELPDMIRGYEGVKLGNVNRYRARAAELAHQLEGAAGSLLSPDVGLEP